MKKKVLSLLLAVVMTFSLAVTANAAEETAQDLDGDIVILHTNDVHGAVNGYACIAALKADYEAKGAEVILVDAGDFSQGTTYVSVTKGADAVTMMNAAGYDVVTLGNHEFDYGYAQLKENMSKAKFKVVCADVFNENGTPIFDANYTYTTKSGVKVGFFGMETPETQTKANPALIKGLTFATDDAFTKAAADQVAALDGAVTHDDDLFEDLLVFTQGHIECAPGTDRLFGGLEAQVHEDERRIVPGKRERIPAVGIGRRTHDGVLHQYTHAGQRLAGLIGDTAHDGMFPLQRGFGSRCRGGRGGCRQGDHLILDFIRDARACEDRGKHFVERRAVQCDIHIGHRTLPERRFIGKDHARLPGKSRDDLAQRGTAERQLQVVALCGESGTGIRRSERRKREAGA